MKTEIVKHEELYFVRHTRWWAKNGFLSNFKHSDNEFYYHQTDRGYVRNSSFESVQKAEDAYEEFKLTSGFKFGKFEVVKVLV